MTINKLSIVIPTYNEAKTIETVLMRVEEADLGVEKEIIVVDDGSFDESKLVLRRHIGKPNYEIIFHHRNQGKGAALRTGFEKATGDYVVVQDADLEYDPEDFKRMIAKIKETGAKAVYGSRTLVRNPKGGFFYDIGGHFLSFLTNLLYGTKITDEPTCYKMFEAELLRGIPLNCTGFEFCPEITAKVARMGVSIYEVPISYTPRSVKDGKKIKFRDGVIAIWTLIKYRFF